MYKVIVHVEDGTTSFYKARMGIFGMHFPGENIAPKDGYLDLLRAIDYLYKKEYSPLEKTILAYARASIFEDSSLNKIFEENIVEPMQENSLNIKHGRTLLSRLGVNPKNVQYKGQNSHNYLVRYREIDPLCKEDLSDPIEVVPLRLNDLYDTVKSIASTVKPFALAFSTGLIAAGIGEYPMFFMNSSDNGIIDLLIKTTFSMLCITTAFILAGYIGNRYEYNDGFCSEGFDKYGLMSFLGSCATVGSTILLNNGD